MARGANGRSQPAQSQARNAPRPSQSQRAEAARRARVEDEEDLGEEYGDAMEEDDEDGDGGNAVRAVISRFSSQAGGMLNSRGICWLSIGDHEKSTCPGQIGTVQ